MIYYLRHETVKNLHSKEPEITQVIPMIKVICRDSKLVLVQTLLTVVCVPKKSRRKKEVIWLHKGQSIIDVKLIEG